MSWSKRLTLDLRLGDVGDSAEVWPSENGSLERAAFEDRAVSSYREVANEAIAMVGRRVQVSVGDIASSTTAVLVDSLVRDVWASDTGWALSLVEGTDIYLDEEAYVKGEAQSGSFSATFGSLEIDVWTIDDCRGGGGERTATET